MDMKENARGQGGRKGTTDQETELSKAHGVNDVAGPAALKPSFASMQAYAEAGHCLILLHRGDKRPISTGWTHTQTNSAEVLAQAEREGLNVGVRLRPTDLVIDADPRNYPAGRDSLAELNGAGIDVVGISPDKPEKLAKFRDAEGLTFPLLSDPERKVLTAYGAFGEKQMYGKTVTGVIRSTFVVDEKGKIAVAQYNVKATGHVAKLRRDLSV